MRTDHKVAIATIVVISTAVLAWSLFSKPKPDDKKSTENNSPKGTKSKTENESQSADSVKEREIKNDKPKEEDVKKEVISPKEPLVTDNTEQQTEQQAPIINGNADEKVASPQEPLAVSPQEEHSEQQAEDKIASPQEPVSSSIIEEKDEPQPLALNDDAQNEEAIQKPFVTENAEEITEQEALVTDEVATPQEPVFSNNIEEKDEPEILTVNGEVQEPLVTSNIIQDEQQPLAINGNVEEPLVNEEKDEQKVVVNDENKQQTTVKINPYAAPFVPRSYRPKKPSLEEVLGSQKQTRNPTKKSRCTYWPKCSNKNCKFFHPQTPCRSGDSCRFGKKCIYLHPGDLAPLK